MFDIDGVLSCNKSRVHHIFEEPPDWDSYHAGLAEDPALPLVNLTRMLWNGGVYVILLTNRLAAFQEATEAWLASRDVFYDDMFMRGGDHEWGSAPYEEFKPTALAGLHEDYDIQIIFEDEPRLASIFEAAGWNVQYIHSGYYIRFVNPDDHGQ